VTSLLLLRQHLTNDGNEHVCCSGRGVSLAMMTHWVCNFALGQLFLPIVASVGVAKVYIGFAAVAIAGALFVQNVLVETKGRNAEEIYELMK
jgi:Sugar (and other) transporter